jgi:hypothetical protein
VQLKNYLQNKRVPLMTYLELTHRCSFLCVHCYIPESLRQARPLAENPARGLSTAVTEELLLDLDKETVDWQDNYDSTRKEPKVLPGKLPNLLLTGSLSIPSLLDSKPDIFYRGLLSDKVLQLEMKTTIQNR